MSFVILSSSADQNLQLIANFIIASAVRTLHKKKFFAFNQRDFYFLILYKHLHDFKHMSTM